MKQLSILAMALLIPTMASCAGRKVASPKAPAATPSLGEELASKGEAVMSCEAAQLYDTTDDTHDGDETPKFKDSDLKIEVHDSERGLYGYLAEITYDGKNKVEKDVRVYSSNPGDMPYLKVMMGAMAPDFDFGKVKSVHVANVGTKANDRGTGTFIYDLLGDKGESLGKIATKILSSFRCGK